MLQRIPTWLMVLVSFVLVVVVLQVGYTFWRRAESSAVGPAVRVVGIPKELDTRDLKILNFYTSTTVPVRGEPFVLCYGVLNAKSVSMEPPLAPISPSINRCVEVMLRKETKLTLRATGRDGELAEASFVLGVSEPRPAFEFISVSAKEIRAGEKFTLCYGVKNATRVVLRPPGPPMTPGTKQCYFWYPTTGPLELVAESAGGREQVTLPLRVRR